MKGILLAGGKGSRLYPATSVLSKHLINIYDKPMIYYSLAVLLKAGIREVLIISMERDRQLYQNLLGDGKKYGINISYAIQDEPKGIAEAFLIGKDFIDHDSVCLVLGDNVFFGKDFDKAVAKCAKLKEGAFIFGCKVKDPERYGVVKFDANNKVLGIIEKPKEYISDIAVAGVYFYDNSVVDIASNLTPSARGELEITDVNNEYLKREALYLHVLENEVKWLDTGTSDSLKEAVDRIAEYEKKTGRLIACLEEIAYAQGNISKNELQAELSEMPDCEYKNYLSGLV